MVQKEQIQSTYNCSTATVSPISSAIYKSTNNTIMARIKELQLVKVGNSYMVTIPKAYLEIQSKYCQDNKSILLGLLYPNEIMEYETQCQTLLK
jgi:hypothetical protein